MLDSEHSGNDPRAMEALIRAPDSVGLTSFVQVPQATYEASIHRMLEAGGIATDTFLPMTPGELAHSAVVEVLAAGLLLASLHC